MGRGDLGRGDRAGRHHHGGAPGSPTRAGARVEAFYASRASRVPVGKARTVVTALAAIGGEAAAADLLIEAGITNSQYGPAREELLRSGLVHAPTRGRLAFTVPGFDRWLDRNPLRS